MSGAVIGSVKLFLKKSFGSRAIMAYQLDRKLEELELERKQVLHHLALLDANIAIIQQAIELMQTENDITLYNTENFVYCRTTKLFKGKIRKYILQMLRDEPTKSFTIAEITRHIFVIEQNETRPTEKHFDSIRKQLNVFYQKGLINRIQLSRNDVRWQLKPISL